MERFGELKLAITQCSDDRLTIRPDLSGRRSGLKNRSCYLDSTLEKQTFFTEAVGRITHQGLKELIELNWDLALKKHYRIEYIINWNAESNYAAILKAKPGLNRQQTQHLAYTLSNKVTMIPNLIGYFQEHPENLEDINYQLFFTYMLFSGDGLNEVILNKPLILEKLFNFLEEQYLLQKGLGNIQQQLFFLSFADNLKQLVRESNPAVENHLTFDIQQEFSEVVSKIVDNTLEGKRLKALAYQHYIASFNTLDPLSQENCSELAKGFAYVTAFGFDKALSFPCSVENMHKTMDRVHRNIKSFDTTFHKNLVHDISKEVLDYKEGLWRGDYPHFDDQKSSYKIDLDSFTLFDQDTVIGSLPQEFIQHPYFQKVIGNNPFISIPVKPGLYELKLSPLGEDHPKFRLYFSKSDHSLKISKQINNEWYTYIPNSELDGILRPASLIQNHRHWVI